MKTPDPDDLIDELLCIIAREIRKLDDRTRTKTDPLTNDVARAANLLEKLTRLSMMRRGDPKEDVSDEEVELALERLRRKRESS